MTLPALITKMSGHRPRFVTVDGLVISNGAVVTTETGHHHPTHGAVTPVRCHTDHGGEPLRETRGTAWWMLKPAPLEQEIRTMARAFPSFEFIRVDGRPAWHGVIDSGRGRFGITVVHRPDGRLPRVVPDQPNLFRRRERGRFRRSPHLFRSGDLCVASESDWDLERDDVTVVVAWAAEWLATFTTWRITGREWPCEQVVVDAA